MIKYIKGSLFDAPGGSTLIHACNTKGVWGAGIAEEFKERFPKAFEQYHLYCTLDGSRKDLRGQFQHIHMVKDSHRIGCLFTSAGYGQNVDDEETILIHTVLSVKEAMKYATRESSYNNWTPTTVYSNKFNSGLFGVQWEKTAKIIETLLPKYSYVRWAVYDNS